MRVELAPEIFRDTDPATATPYGPQDLHHLYDLLRCFVEGRHHWVADATVAVAVQDFLPGHLPQLAGTYAALARKASVTAQAWTGTSQAADVVRVTRSDLAEHAVDLCQRAVLVVENQLNDGYFLTTVAHVLGDKRIVTALSEGWLDIVNGGGSTLLMVARQVAGRFRRVVRVAAILDSDRLIPRQRTGNHDKADQLQGWGVATHVLQRREAENYVPHRILAGTGRPGEASRRLTLLKRLTAEQRDHYDMKHGFKKVDRSAQVRSAFDELFNALDQETRTGLHDGFGSDLLERLHTHRAALTEHDFHQLGEEVVAELRALLATIAGRI